MNKVVTALLPAEEDEAQDTLEDLYLVSTARESKNEPTRPFSEVVEEMRAAGEIDVERRG